jgi:hypothetical protein
MRSIIARPLQLHIRAIVEDTARPEGKHSRPNDSSWLEENGHSIKTDGPKAIVWLGRILSCVTFPTVQCRHNPNK